jgi:hypothetical protein
MIGVCARLSPSSRPCGSGENAIAIGDECDVPVTWPRSHHSRVTGPSRDSSGECSGHQSCLPRDAHGLAGKEAMMHYPRPPQRPQAYRVPPGTLHQYAIRSSRGNLKPAWRAVLARLQGPQLARR